jgi:hypothetical protein
LEVVWQSTVRHTAEELARYGSISEQLPFRKKLVLEQLKASGIDLFSLRAVNVLVCHVGVIERIFRCSFPTGIVCVRSFFHRHRLLQFTRGVRRRSCVAEYCRAKQERHDRFLS